jgi:hypothetical protein
MDTVTVIDASVRSTDSTCAPGMPSSTSQRSHGSVVVGAAPHPVALDNVEVLEIDQVAWSLLIIGDLDPYTQHAQPVTRPGSLPTGSAKTRIRPDSTSSRVTEQRQLDPARRRAHVFAHMCGRRGGASVSGPARRFDSGPRVS